MNFTFDDVEEIRFTVVQGANPGSKIPFAPGARTVRIGRAVDNDIVVNDPAVSRSHVRIEVQEGKCLIADAGSRGGVEKMGFRVGTAPEPLESGDEFKVGNTILRFEVVLRKSAVKRVKAEAAGKKTAAPKFQPKEVFAVFQRSLSLIGLRTPSMQIIALAVFACILVLGLWPQAPGLPPQAGGEPVPVNYDIVAGFMEGGDQSHLDGAIFQLPTRGEGMSFYFKTLAPSGLEVSAGQYPSGTIEPDANWRNYEVLLLSRAVARSDEAYVILNNLGYDPSEGAVDPTTVKPWAVARIWVMGIPRAAALPARLSEEIRVLQGLSERLTDEPGNLYQLLTGLRTSTLGFMKLSGRPTVLVPIPKVIKAFSVAPALEAARQAIEGETPAKGVDPLVEALGLVEAEVDRRYQEQMNTLKLLERRNASADRGRLLALAEAQMPESTDPRHRSILSEIGKLDEPGRMAYDEAKRLAAEGPEG